MLLFLEKEFVQLYSRVILASLTVCLSTLAAEPPPAEMHPMGGKEQPVPVRVAGQVLDAATGQPLPVFFLTPGVQSRDRSGFDWDETNRLLYTRGTFTTILRKEKNLTPGVMIEAEGYLPQCSAPIDDSETNLIFRLEKGDGPQGVVLTPDGKPAAGRKVYFTRSRPSYKERLGDLLYLQGQQLVPIEASKHMRSTITDQSGHFAFEPALDGYSVLVVDDSGFAAVRLEDLKSSHEIRLQPYARIEGTLYVGDKPAANETVRLVDAFASAAYFPRGLPEYSILVQTNTDAQGHFVFPRVPPVDVKVFHMPKVGSADAHLAPMTQLTNITLMPGETRSIVLGGKGRPVTGRVVLKGYSKPVHWEDQVFWIYLVTQAPADAPNYDAIDAEYHRNRNAANNHEQVVMVQNHYLEEREKVAAQMRAYYSRSAGRQYWFSNRQYVLRFSQDGSFRIDDVPGGKYRLDIDLRDLYKQWGQEKSPMISFYENEFVVPDSPGGRSDVPCDLGVIKMLKKLTQGDPAPDFSLQTLDKRTIKLSAYKDKCVLLYFWASRNAASADFGPILRETYAAYKNDPRFIMIGLNLDNDIASARDYAEKNHLAWTQAFLGKWADTEVPDAYGIQSLPYVVIIGPGGRILAGDLQPGNTKTTVEMALSVNEKQ